MAFIIIIYYYCLLRFIILKMIFKIYFNLNNHFYFNYFLPNMKYYLYNYLNYYLIKYLMIFFDYYFKNFNFNHPYLIKMIH
jgi:hypothetical protein